MIDMKPSLFSDACEAGHRRMIGVSQGRLIRPYNGELQCFPKDHWETEIYLADAVGLDFIEFLAERNFNSENPLWFESGQKTLFAASNIVGSKMYSSCNDYIIDHSALEDSSCEEFSLKLLESMKSIGCSLFVLPFFEKSEMNSINYEQFIPFISHISNEARKRGIRISLETSLDSGALLNLIAKIDAPNVGVCFDTGNRVVKRRDSSQEIQELGAFINHVHLKDKTAEGLNVVLGTGLVNFLDVFTALKQLNYQGHFVFETNRGRDPFKTMHHNLQFVKFMMHEAGWN